MNDRNIGIALLRDTALLTIADARKLGLLQPFVGLRPLNIPYRIWVDWQQPSTLRFHVPIHPTVSDGFPLTDQRFWDDVEVELTSSQFHFGDRPYFICPITEKKCLKLFFYNGILCSKPVFKAMAVAQAYAPLSNDLVEARSQLLSLSRTRRWSNRSRRKHLADLMKLEGLDPAADKRIAQEQSRDERREDHRLWECRRLSTSKALDEGLGYGESSMFHTMLLRPDEWLESPSPSVEACRASEAGFIDSYGELDIRVLIDRGVFGPHAPTARLLGWSARDGLGDHVIMHIIPQDDALPFLIFQFVAFDGASVFQRIELIATRDSVRPRYFICPVERAKTDILYLRDGFFASRSAHFLRYPPGGKAALIKKIKQNIPSLGTSRSV